MGAEFTFYDYIDANGDKANVIKEWLNGEGQPAKLWFTMTIGYLEASPPQGFADSVWGDPYTERMEKKRGVDWSGFTALRKKGKVNYRLIGEVRDRKVFLVAHGVHKGQNYPTDISPKTASERVSQMISDPKYRREHEYD